MIMQEIENLIELLKVNRFEYTYIHQVSTILQHFASTPKEIRRDFFLQMREGLGNKDDKIDSSLFFILKLMAMNNNSSPAVKPTKNNTPNTNN